MKTVPRTGAELDRIEAATALPGSFDAPQRYETRSAGAATVRARADSDAFSQPSGNISFEGELNFRVGDGLFRKLWVSAPSSTLASDGLGPLFNARSCQRCHLKDGRGRPPADRNDSAVSMMLLVSIPGDPEDAIADTEGYFATRPEPSYGSQLHDFSLAGHTAEYRLRIDYEETEVSLAGGESVYLRSPAYTPTGLGYGPLHDGAMLSPRVAPQMMGLSLLEAIPAADILANADPDDADGDGISGRPMLILMTPTATAFPGGQTSSGRSSSTCRCSVVSA